MFVIFVSFNLYVTCYISIIFIHIRTKIVNRPHSSVIYNNLNSLNRGPCLLISDVLNDRLYRSSNTPNYDYKKILSIIADKLNYGLIYSFPHQLG